MDLFEYALCGIGVAAGIVTTIRLFKAPPLKIVIVGYLATLLFLGFGQYGIPFLKPFTDLVQGLGDVIGSPSEQSYEAFLDEAGSGGVPKETRTAGLALMLEHPVENMDEILEQAAGRATDEQARTDILAARERYAATAELAQQVAANGGTLSEKARAAAIRPLLKLPESEIRRLRIDPQKVDAAKRRVPRTWVLRDTRLRHR